MRQTAYIYICISETHFSLHLPHHINLCTLPGSCGQPYPQLRKIYPVTALTTKNQIVSNQSLVSYSCHNARDHFAIPPLSSFTVLDGFGAANGTRSRHMIQGRMKYRGSTSGAVTSCRAEVASQTSRKLTVQPSPLVASFTCTVSLNGGLAFEFLAGAAFPGSLDGACVPLLALILFLGGVIN